jgi:P4 family phage/plasmid primase-like protien
MNKITNTQSQMAELSTFLTNHNACDSKQGLKNTHTRIPDSNLNIHPGSYYISKEELSLFHTIYYEHIFMKNRKEYLTERQLVDNGPLLVDIDIKYDYNISERQHNKHHIIEIISLYLDELKTFYVFDENTNFDVFVFEKPNVNRLEDKNITKDGIHLLFGIQVDRIIQVMLREKMLKILSETFSDLPITNNIEDILDNAITKGSAPWQMYGSRKPGHEAYELTQYHTITYDNSDGQFMLNEKSAKLFDLKNNFIKLSAQNEDNPKFEINPKIREIYNTKLEEHNKKLGSSDLKIKKTYSKHKLNLLDNDDDDSNDNISLNEIKNKEILARALENILSKLTISEYEIKEIHEYTQILPEKYYEPGSHLLNRQVAFALKHTDERLFLSWVMLRSKASDFNYNTIPTLYYDWKKYFNTSKEGVTKRSIMYWAKQDAFEEYEKVKLKTINHYIDQTLSGQTEYDVAKVLYQMYKDKYVCVSYDKKGVWYIFKKHRWELDRGLTIRNAISEELYNIYYSVRDTHEHKLEVESDKDLRSDIQSKISTISCLLLKLRKTNDKNNIYRETMEIFHDANFVKNMDTNKHLLCFKNGVVDFKNKVFRDGYPQDYITKTTGINYIEYNIKNPDIKSISDDILLFMEKLFPIKDLNRYMWDHLASCLIGTNMNQTFNVYFGSGSNGKSILIDLMTQTLGEYKGTVPITLVTEKRNNIGGTSSEIMQLKGIRYAVMQEPTKGVKLNEGIMKELTGGDPIQGRALYCESETFEPQFNLVVCTNNLFEVGSNDDGTWRRIRKNDFLAKFVDEGEEHTDDTKYVFTKDKFLKDKLPRFAPIFASMLVKRAFETNGVVIDCDIVMEASNKYRKGQDHIAAFVSENVSKTGNNKDLIKKTELVNQFKFWFQLEQGQKNMPKAQELYDYMDKKFGNHKTTGWHCVKIIYPEATDEMNDLHDA